MSRTGNNCLETLRAAVADAGLHAPDVSKWTVGMQVHHCALAMVSISTALLASSPPPPPSGLSIPRAVVLSTGRIPRGRGKSPPTAVPSAHIQQGDLLELLQQSDVLIRQVAEAESDQWWSHVFFGPMNRDQTIRFVGIHNRHHLRIISDIQRAVG